MDKLNRLIILTLILCFLGSCNKDNYNSDYKLYFAYNPWTKVNLTDNNLQIEYGQFKYSDSLIFSQSELKEIINSFFRNEIDKIEGEIMLAKGMINMPPVDFTILSFRNNVLISEITINENYSIDEFWPFGEQYRIMMFQKDVLRILEKNKRFKKAIDAFLSYKSSELLKHRQ